MAKIFFRTFLVSIFLFSTGCAFFSATPGKDGTSFQYGKMSGILNANLQDSSDAALKTTKEFEFMKVEHRKDIFTAILIVKNAKNEKITITMEKLGDSATRISIKAGLVGDQFLSQQIFEKTKANL